MNDDVPLGLLFGLLFVLLLLSAFLSSSETALMSLNRYRLRQRALAGQRSAKLAEQLLERPDRLIGFMFLGRNAANLAAAAVATMLALRLGGEAAVLASTVVLTVVVLIFAEVAPKTIAALQPAKVGLPAALICYPLMKAAAPVSAGIDVMARGLLRVLGADPEQAARGGRNTADLGAVVADAGVMVPRRHQRMLLSVFDLEAITVDDVMVPRQEIVGIDLDEDWPQNLATIRATQHQRLPVYRDDIDNIIGVVRVRQLLPDLAKGALNAQRLLEHTREAYYVPEGTPLNQQLANFQQQKRRSAFVVDEYGDVQGLITTEDILREVVGELDSEPVMSEIGVTRESDHSFVVDASTNIRRLNRLMSWDLPIEGPKTLNGLIIERLETIPPSGTALIVSGYPIEILDTTEHGIKQVRVMTPHAEEPPRLRAAQG